MPTSPDYVTHPLASGHPPAWASEWGQDRHGVFAGFTVGEVVQRMRWIPQGRFLMGSPPDEPERFDDEAQHEVYFPRGFWLADTACTQALWREVAGDEPSHWRGDVLPVEQVSFDAIVERFLPALNRRAPGLQARLPTEAEWEYACRAGTTTPFSFGANITTEQVNYDGNYPYAGGPKGAYREATVPVASLPPNPWGLFEMHGNVREWCADAYGPYPAGPVLDGSVLQESGGRGAARALRGGSWGDSARDCRSAYRGVFVPGDAWQGDGFRLARGPE